MHNNKIDRFRGWILMALYACMAILCLMLMLAAFQFWPSLEDGSATVFLLAAAAAITAILSVRTSFCFYKALKAGERPKLAMVPFFLMAVTLFTASKLFAGV